MLPEEVLHFLTASGLAGPRERPSAQALSGGVSSDIWRVDLARGAVCVKRALPRLRVAQLWEAPVERNRYEYEWFRMAAKAVPQAVPSVLAEGKGFFAMEFLDPSRHPVWKELLRQGRADASFAAKVGAALASIHASTAGSAQARELFSTDAIFYAIRLEPYLVATGVRHPDLQGKFEELVKITKSTKLCLVHGDVSPKNILSGPRGPVFLDAECAWYGDPAFDLAFCLNHLLLKCLWVPQAKERFLSSFDSLYLAYLKGISWEEPKTFEKRTAALLPGLFLARVDGKSPVEYVTAEAQKDMVRRVARPLIERPVDTLSEVKEAWRRSLP